LPGCLPSNSFILWDTEVRDWTKLIWWLKTGKQLPDPEIIPVLRGIKIEQIINRIDGY